MPIGTRVTKLTGPLLGFSLGASIVGAAAFGLSPGSSIIRHDVYKMPLPDGAEPEIKKLAEALFNESDLLDEICFEQRGSQWKFSAYGGRVVTSRELAGSGAVIVIGHVGAGGKAEFTAGAEVGAYR